MKEKEKMKLQELQKLAERVQLKIKPEEAECLLESFSKLEGLLIEFRKLNNSIEGEQLSWQPRAKITLKNLHRLTKKFASHLIKQETVYHNAEIAKKLLVIRKK